MNTTQSEYNTQRRQRPEAVALLMMSMTLSVAPNTMTHIAVGAVRHSNCQFDASSPAYVVNIMKLFAIDRRKRQIKQRIYNVEGVHLPDDLFSLPYQTADQLAILEIEPDYILSTEDKGLSIEFRQDGIYHLIEFLPTGEIVLLKKQGKQINTWDLTADNYLLTLQNQLA